VSDQPRVHPAAHGGFPYHHVLGLLLRAVVAFGLIGFSGVTFRNDQYLLSAFGLLLAVGLTFGLVAYVAEAEPISVGLRLTVADLPVELHAVGMFATTVECVLKSA